MKAIQALAAVMLLGSLSVAVGSNVAVAKGRHHISEDGSRGMSPSDGAQESGGNRGISAAKNSTVSGNNAGANQNVRGPVNAGPMKKGDNLPGKSAPQNAGVPQSGKNQIGPGLNTMQPGSSDAGKGTPVIADGPGHKTNRPADVTKKITTIIRPNVVREPQRPTGSAKIERNSIGTVVHQEANPNWGLDPKVNAKVNGAPTGLAVPTTTKPIASLGMPTATTRLGRNVSDPSKHGSIINGTSFSQRGSNVTSIGGPTKNVVGALSGNSFKPKHP